MRPPPRFAGHEELLAQMDWVRALARRLVADSELAADLEQSAWVAALERPPRMDGGEAGLRGWLAAVMRNAARQLRRGEERRRAREAERARPDRGEEDVADVVARGALQKRVTDAVMQLEEPYRSAVLHRYLDGHDAPRIAELQGITPAAARKRLSRGLEILRARLERSCGGDRGLLSAGLVALAGRGPSSAPAASGLAATTLFAAGVAMGTKIKLGAGGLALLSCLTLAWWPLGEDAEGPEVGQDAGAPLETGALAPPQKPSPPEETAVRSSSGRAPLPDAPAAPTGARALEVFTGGVESRAGVPIAGATVALHHKLGTWHGREPLASGTTDAEGRFRLELEAGAPRPCQVPSLWLSLIHI